MFCLIRTAILSLSVAALLLSATPARSGVDHLTQRFENGRTGWNPNETLLNVRNVNADSFGKLWSRQVDGQFMPSRSTSGTFRFRESGAGTSSSPRPSTTRSTPSTPPRERQASHHSGRSTLGRAFHRRSSGAATSKAPNTASPGRPSSIRRPERSTSSPRRWRRESSSIVSTAWMSPRVSSVRAGRSSSKVRSRGTAGPVGTDKSSSVRRSSSSAPACCC